MLVLRASKTMAVAVAAMGLLVSLVAFGNLTDYDTNFAFVQHVLLMDTTFPSSTIRYRAITNPALYHAAYALIIAAEILTAALCWMGALQLWRHLGDTGRRDAPRKLADVRPRRRLQGDNAHLRRSRGRLFGLRLVTCGNNENDGSKSSPSGNYARVDVHPVPLFAPAAQ